MDFYQFFSFSAKKAIYRAGETCSQFNNQHLDPEHILYAILNLRSCSAVQVLHQLGINLPKLTYSLEAYLYEHSGSFKGQASFSKRTILLLDAAMKEVKRLHHREIGTTHLLTALAQERDSFLRNLFAEHDLDAKKIRDTFMTHLKGYADQHGKPDLQFTREASVWDQERTATEGSGYFNVLSRAARHAVEHAFNLANVLGSPQVTPEHVVYCMINDAKSIVSRTLRERGADHGLLMSELLGHVRKLKPAGETAEPKLGMHTLQALTMSFELMAKLNRPEINTAHLLVSMLQIPELKVRKLFDRHELTEKILADARQIISEVTGEEPIAPPQAGDDEDNGDSVDEAETANGESPEGS